MKMLIIRHGDPDYENDLLTEHGRLEKMGRFAARFCECFDDDTRYD